jgi:hypothetical protein
VKNLKAWKITDLVVQLLALGLPWLLFSVFPAHQRIWHVENLISLYLAAGLTQLMSTIMNWRLLPASYRAKSRSWYETLMLMLAAMAIIATIMKSTLLLLLVLFYLTPFITLWYLILSVIELSHIFKQHET